MTTLITAAKETNKSGAGFSKSRNFLSLILGATIPFIIIIFAIPMLQAIKLPPLGFSYMKTKLYKW